MPETNNIDEVDEVATTNKQAPKTGESVAYDVGQAVVCEYCGRS